MTEASEGGGGPSDAGMFSPRPLPSRPPRLRRPDPAIAADPTGVMPAADADRPHATRVVPRFRRPTAGPYDDERPTPPGRPGRDGFRRRALVGLGLLGVLVAVVVVLWVVDGQAHKGVVARNVVLLDRTVGGMDRQEVAAAVDLLAERYGSSAVEVKAPEGGFRAAAPELGMSVRRDATVDAALNVGREGFVLGRIWDWATGFVVSRQTRVVLDVDEKAVRQVVAERDPLRQPPVEPNITLEGGRIVAVDGKPGRGIDPATVVDALRSGAGQRFPLEVSVPRRSVPPVYTLADAERLAAEAEALAVGELPTWLRGVPSDNGLRLGIDADGAAEALSALFPEAGNAPVDAGLAVSGGGVVVTPAETGTACCAPEAVTAIEDALRNRRPGDPPVDLPLKVIPPSRDEDAVRRLGVTEVIGSFTTNHPAGEPRVTNIHRIADLVQGAIIEPGGTFSLNGHVGERTVAKGFVEAPVIDAEYKFSKDVGGGVSQFSTTLFNAAFFAGLDIPTYGMHGIYISRYPYGREATLDYPSLDLKVGNPTPYGVLIWPSYSSTSITVTLYSTRTVSGEQTGQTTEEIATTQVRPTTTTVAAPPDPDPTAPTTEAPPVTEPPEPERFVCTRVVTERTRTYNDGRTAVDRFYALYAPEEGIVCPR
jgi:vancomycin resistance protein YoaR